MMNRKFKPHDKVKMQLQLARNLGSRSEIYSAKRGFSWADRVGEVVKCNEYCVTIMWPGRKSLDYLPPQALQLVE